MWVGKLCCWLVAACQRAQDLPRALEWCAQVDGLCAERDLAPLLTACRIQYASIRLATGQWIEAERELVAALDRMRGSHRAARVDAVVQLGHLRRRQDRLDEADELYLQAGYAPQAIVGRALVLLARGDAVAAWALAVRCLDDVPTADCPSAPGPAPRRPLRRRARATGTPPCPPPRSSVDRGRVGHEGVRGASAVASALVADAGAPGANGGSPSGVSIGPACSVDEAEARVQLARSLADEEPTVVADELARRSPCSSRSTPPRASPPRAPCSMRRRRTGRLAPHAPRGTEVLRLVASGRSNTQIAAELVVSEHTVHRHVANILTRLDEPTRGAAAARGVRDGLI